jgi:hypothetical protein
MILLQPAPAQYSKQDQDELRRKIMVFLRDFEARLRVLESA